MTKIPHICTIKELAKETNISEHTIRCWVKQKKFKYLQSGRKYLINFDVFMKFLNSEEDTEEKPHTNIVGIRKVVGQ